MQNNSNEDLTLYYIIISRDKKVEKKCTLYPLRGRKNFFFRTRFDPGEFEPESILLFLDGEPLTTELVTEIQKRIAENELKTNHEDDTKGNPKGHVLEIVLIDTRWKKARGVLDSLPPIRTVSLEGFVTGAVRKDPPPQGGLASVEALYLVSLLFGKPDPTLLDNYHFRERFFELNERELSNYDY